MRLFDVNILLNAHRQENVGHPFYSAWLEAQLESDEGFFYCDWILSSFLRIVTRTNFYSNPTPASIAFACMDAVRSHPRAIPIMPGARHWEIFTHLCEKQQATGNAVPDAYLAALAIEANAEWVTADRDFLRFRPDLKLELLLPN